MSHFSEMSSTCCVSQQMVKIYFLSLAVTLYLMKSFRDKAFGLGVLHFENAKVIALLRVFCRNDFEMVVSVVINCIYFEDVDSFTSGSKDKTWGRLELREVGRGAENRKEELVGNTDQCWKPLHDLFMDGCPHSICRFVPDATKFIDSNPAYECKSYCLGFLLKLYCNQQCAYLHPVTVMYSYSH